MNFPENTSSLRPASLISVTPNYTVRLSQEAIFVGAYCAILYIIIYSISTVILPKMTSRMFSSPSVFLWGFLFVLGFVKHSTGYYLGLHSYYCQNKNSTGYLQTKSDHHIWNDTYPNIWLSSVGEGLLFITMGWIFFGVLGSTEVSFARRNNDVFSGKLHTDEHPILSIFIIGILLHLLSDTIGYHRYFCLHYSE
jgi:hypothetical protein